MGVVVPLETKWKSLSGELVPIPTFPDESIRIASAPPSAKAMVSAAGKKMPVFVSPTGDNAGAPTVPAGIANVFDIITGDAMLILEG
jgi:hypothetical protein